MYMKRPSLSHVDIIMQKRELSRHFTDTITILKYAATEFSRVIRYNPSFLSRNEERGGKL